VVHILPADHTPSAAADNILLAASAVAHNTRSKTGDEGLGTGLGRAARAAGKERRCSILIVEREMHRGVHCISVPF
jgi:hypothetical protein